MSGLVSDGALVVVSPCSVDKLEPGDVVLVRVAGNVYHHKILKVGADGRYQIGNNRGGVNGWARPEAVAGLCTSVDGTPRPRLQGKLGAPAGH